jgi:hypothetical protein
MRSQCLSNPLAYVFVAGIAALFVALLVFEWYMVGRTRAGLRLAPFAPSPRGGMR